MYNVYACSLFRSFRYIKTSVTEIKRMIIMRLKYELKYTEQFYRL